MCVRRHSNECVDCRRRQCGRHPRNSAAGRPWNDPLNAFAADYSYLSSLWEAISPDPILAQFEDDYRWLSQVYDGRTDLRIAFLAVILPYVEQSAIYSRGNVPAATLNDSGVASQAWMPVTASTVTNEIAQPSRHHIDGVGCFLMVSPDQTAPQRKISSIGV